MAFLNIFLAAGLAAISAPILIHLIHRGKIMRQDWGAMMFLEELLAERARQIQLREILLLLIRSGIVACVALALMRPILQLASSGVRSGSSHTSAIILMDDSVSMNAGRPQTAFVEARDIALRYIDTLHRGDDVTVLFTSSAGNGAPPALLYDLDRAREIVRSAAPRFEKADIPHAISAAVQQLDARPNPRRELVVVSDMQAHDWKLDDATRWSFLGNAVHSSRVTPNIILAGVARRQPANAAVTGVTLSRAIVDCFSPVTFNFSIENNGSEPLNGITVSFAADGVTKTTRSMDLAPNAKMVVGFEHRFDAPGSHYVACRLRCAADMLPEDDELLYSVPVTDRLPVLLVDGNRREQALAGSAGFLAIALAPKDKDDPAWRTVIETKTIDMSELRSADLSKFKAVVLANVAAVPGSIVSDLEKFVFAGGGLLVVLGERVQIDAYNRDLFRQGGGLLPVRLEHTAYALEGVDTRPVEAVHLAAIVSDSPSLELFRPEKGQDWSKASIRNYFFTAPSSGKEDVHTLAAFSNGTPALIQKKLGEGKVTLLTTAADLKWSDLPMHPFYVPLMQNLVFDLASTMIPPRNLHVGQTLSHVATGAQEGKTFFVTPPSGEPIALKSQAQGALSISTFENTAKPGLYTVAPEDGATGERLYYTVTTDRGESNLTRLQESDFAHLERDVGVRYARDWSTVAHFAGLDSGGFEISQWLIIAAIALCFVEVLLTRRWM
jgi:hypothetical protein